LLLGAGIMAVELPTAFPYFGALLAILGVKGLARQALLVVAYNIVFVAPLLCLIVVAAAGGTVRRRIGTLFRGGHRPWAGCHSDRRRVHRRRPYRHRHQRVVGIIRNEPPGTSAGGCASTRTPPA